MGGAGGIDGSEQAACDGRFAEGGRARSDACGGSGSAGGGGDGAGTRQAIAPALIRLSTVSSAMPDQCKHGRAPKNARRRVRAVPHHQPARTRLGGSEPAFAVHGNCGNAPRVAPGARERSRQVGSPPTTHKAAPLPAAAPITCGRCRCSHGRDSGSRPGSGQTGRRAAREGAASWLRGMRRLGGQEV